MPESVLARIGRHALLAVAIALGLCACQPPATPAPACVLTVAPRTFAPCLATGEATTSVAAPSMCAWTAESNVPWITVISGASGRGAGAVSFTYGTNYDAPRVGWVTVRSPVAQEQVTVAQAGCRYGVSQSLFAFVADGGTGVFDVVQQTDPYACGGPLQDTCVWTAVADAAWISIATTAPHAGDGRVSFTIAPNPGAVGRLGVITVRGRVVQIAQSGR